MKIKVDMVKEEKEEMKITSMMMMVKKKRLREEVKIDIRPKLLAITPQV